MKIRYIVWPLVIIFIGIATISDYFFFPDHTKSLFWGIPITILGIIILILRLKRLYKLQK